MVKLGHVALDGTKIKANASKHKAMSYERMKKREAELQAEVDRWLEAAEAADAEEDKLYGGQARRRDAGLGGRQAEAAGQDPRGQGGTRSGSQGRGRGRAHAPRPRQRKTAPGGRPQEERQDAGAADRTEPDRQGAAQLHRSREPHPEDQGRLHPGLQRTGRGRCRGADHRGAGPDAEHERSRTSSCRSSTASRKTSAASQRKPHIRDHSLRF